MTKILQRLGVVLLACACAVPVFAAPGVDGDWIGAFQGRRDWVFVHLVFGGAGEAMTGRADLPVQGEYSIPLHNVSANGRRVRFEIPGAAGNLLFDGSRDGNIINGTVRQGFSSSLFELVRQLPSPEDEFAHVQGHYGRAGELPILVYYSPQGPAYVDFRTGRMGSLFRTGADTYVSGATLLTGYPVEFSMTFARDASGVASSMRRSSKRGDETLERQSPYRTEAVRFRSATANLGGWLLVPNTPGPHPAIVMIHGSGPSTRQSLLPFADVFARNGIAVLVHDKRGSGQSTGSFARATFDDLAQDALAGVALLKGHPDIDGQHIGLLGTSLGGWVAPHAASMSADVRFVIVEAAPATTPAEHERERVQRQMRADGVALDVIAKARAYMDSEARGGPDR